MYRFPCNILLENHDSKTALEDKNQDLSSHPRHFAVKCFKYVPLVSENATISFEMRASNRLNETIIEYSFNHHSIGKSFPNRTNLRYSTFQNFRLPLVRTKLLPFFFDERSHISAFLETVSLLCGNEKFPQRSKTPI